MPDLDLVVRPFVGPGVQGTSIIPSTPGLGTERALLTWGAKADMPSPVSGFANVTFCSEGDQEVGRKTQNVKIQDQNNPDNIMTVARANELSLTKKGGTPDGTSADASAFAPFVNFATEVTSVLNDFGNDFTVQPDGTVTDNCKITWKLNNNTTGTASGLVSSA